MKMKGLYFPHLHQIELKNVDMPKLINDTDVIVKISLTTICGSDLHIIHGRIPSQPGFVLGHEYVGVVHKVGKAVTKFKPGDRVIGPPAPFCGHCESCLNGNYSHCLNGSVHGMLGCGGLSGTHAEYIRVPFADTCLLHVPDTVEDEQAVFIFDILSTGYSAVKMAGIRPDDTVVVFGAGPVGLCAVLTAKLYSPGKIILVGRKDQFRMDLGKELGATHVLRSSECDVVDKIFELTGGRGADAAIDASGSEAAIQQAVRCVGIKGNVSLIGISSDVNLPLSEVFYKNISIHMGLGGLDHASRLMELIAYGKLNIKPLITHRMKLGQIEEAFRIFEKKDENVMKILIQP